MYQNHLQAIRIHPALKSLSI